jgi:hypothetical protein
MNPALEIASAVFLSTVVLSPMIPPNAEIGSQLSAALKALERSLSCATPVGLLCLMITAAGSEKSLTKSTAAFRSRILLNESFFL